MHLLPCAKDTLDTQSAHPRSRFAVNRRATLHPALDPRERQIAPSPVRAVCSSRLSALCLRQAVPHHRFNRAAPTVTLSPQTSELTYRISTEGLSTEDKEKAKQYIQPLVYEWKEAHFVPKH